MHSQLLGFANKPTDELIQALHSLSEMITSLDLTNNKLGNRSIEDLSKILAAIPPGVKFLNLSGNDLEKKTSEELSLFFFSLPANVSSVSLLHNFVDTTNDYTQAFAALPTTLASLDLRFNFFKDTAALIKAIPASISSLSLWGVCIDMKDSQFIEVINAVQKTVTSLDLSQNLIGQKKDITGIFDTIPRQLTHLSLSSNWLGEMLPKTLTQVFSKLPQNILSLDLSDNQLGRHKVLFYALPTTITSLNLSGNAFGKQIDLPGTVASIPFSVTTLDFSGNSLGNKSVVEIVQTLAALPANISSLDLSSNDLGNKTTAEWLQIINAIPASVTRINLSSNKLFVQRTCEERDAILVALQQKGERLCILNENGESDFARALAPMMSLGRQHRKEMPRDVVNHILSFLISPQPSKDAAKFVQEKVSEVEKLQRQSFLKSLETDIKRLASSTNDSGNLWVKIGLLKASDDKIKALKSLKQVMERIEQMTRVEDARKALCDWKKTYENCLNERRNKGHTFLSPNHQNKTTSTVARIFELYEIKEDFLKNSSSPSIC